MAQLIAVLLATATILTFWLGMAVGWVSNLIWLLTHDGGITSQFFVALVGAIAAPLGALHGLYVLF